MTGLGIDADSPVIMISFSINTDREAVDIYHSKSQTRVQSNNDRVKCSHFENKA